MFGDLCTLFAKLYTQSQEAAEKALVNKIVQSNEAREFPWRETRSAKTSENLYLIEPAATRTIIIISDEKYFIVLLVDIHLCSGKNENIFFSIDRQMFVIESIFLFFNQ